MRTPVGLRLAGLATALATSSLPLLAQGGGVPEPPPNDLCLACHGDPERVAADGRRLGVDETAFNDSVHAWLGMACVDCHADLATAVDFPHPERLAPVVCATCHPSVVDTYDTSIHAVARRENGNGIAATCVDCHTTHAIRPASDPASSTYALNLPATCSRCHGDEAVIAAGGIRAGNVAALYEDSIHGRAISASGLLVAPNCSTCHGAHEIQASDDPASRVHHENVPRVCGSCHEGILRLFNASAHGTGVSNGDGRAPVCIDCHTAHDIQRIDAGSWQLEAIRECGTCHVDEIRTYRDTFHGQVTSLGFERVAKCADCHTAHSVHPTADPLSTVSEARRLETCQQCHASATAGFAGYDPHADRHDRERNPLLYYVGLFMDWLLIGVFSFFGLHALLWLPRSMAVRRQQRRAGAGSSSGPGPGGRR
jgi:nitrate/TMAO reductase-like tetraheme cytochrome c subunit